MLILREGVERRMALRKKNRYQTATNFGKDTIFVCNDDSESPFEIGPKSPGKGLLDDRIKRKKRLSVFPVVFAVFVAMCLSLFGYIYYQNLFNPINKKNMVHIQFAPNKEAEFSDYEKYKQTLQERLELFADGRKYFFEETDHYYDVYLPTACFGDARIDNVCRKFLSSTGQIYFVDKEDEQQIFPVEILPQYIESVSKKRVNEKNQSSSYDCLNITLNPEGQKYYASIQSADIGPELMVLDIERGLWHKEDSTRFRDCCTIDNRLYYVWHDSESLTFANEVTCDSYLLVGSGEPSEGNVRVINPVNPTETYSDMPWMATFGPFDEWMENRKIYSKLLLRLLRKKDSAVRVYISINDGAWELVQAFNPAKTGGDYIPIIPRRCDRYSVKIEGTGDCCIKSLTRRVRMGTGGRL